MVFSIFFKKFRDIFVKFKHFIKLLILICAIVCIFKINKHFLMRKLLSNILNLFNAFKNSFNIVILFDL